MPLSAQTNDEVMVVLVHDHWIKYIVPASVYILLGGTSLVLFMFAGWTAYHYIGLTPAKVEDYIRKNAVRL